MTVMRLLLAAARSWYLVLLGVVVTIVVALHVVTAPGVYFAQVDVVFLRPVNPAVPNGLSVTSSSVTATASVVQREVSGGPAAFRVVSEQVTIVGEGITAGQRVRLPNSGGQWANNFDRAVLDVQVADSTEENARRRLQGLLDEIDDSLARRQREAGADPATWIRTRLSPEEPTIRYLVGERRRAAAMTLLLGGGLTCAAVVLIEARRRPGGVVPRLVARPQLRVRRLTSGKRLTES
jgi:hypothetical protein